MPKVQWHTSLMLGSWIVGRTSSNVHRRWLRVPSGARPHIFGFMSALSWVEVYR